MGVRPKDGFLVVAANKGGYWCAVELLPGSALKLAEQLIRAARFAAVPAAPRLAPLVD